MDGDALVAKALSAGELRLGRIREVERSVVVFKVGRPPMEGAHEIQGLRFWRGNPTVQLLAADEEETAMLLEQCEPGHSLRALRA